MAFLAAIFGAAFVLMLLILRDLPAEPEPPPCNEDTQPVMITWREAFVGHDAGDVLTFWPMIRRVAVWAAILTALLLIVMTLLALYVDSWMW